MREVADPSTLNKGAPLRATAPARVPTVLALALALNTGCTTPHARHDAPPHHLATHAQVAPGADTAQAALDAFARAWNAQDADALIATFSPARRPLATAHRQDITRRMAAARVLTARLDHRCHGRAPELLIARLELTPRAQWLTTPTTHAGAAWHEAMWLIHDASGRWWVFSL